jgi:peptide/nickel transport system permease protein
MANASIAVARPGGLWLAFRRNRLSWVGLVLLAAIVLIAAVAPLISPYDPIEQHIAYRLEPPSAEFLLGTDTYGRDVLSRLIHGARISLIVAFAAVAITLLLGLMIAAILGASLENLIIAIAVTEIAPFARIARAPTIALKERDFIEAGRALGFGPLRIMGVHILPNMIADVVVMGSLWMATAIRTEASLSFIGLGVKPPTPTWGGMIREGFENILSAWWLAVFPSLAILLTVLALNLLGDALRDAIDPKLRAE